MAVFDVVSVIINENVTMTLTTIGIYLHRIKGKLTKAKIAAGDFGFS